MGQLLPFLIKNRQFVLVALIILMGVMEIIEHLLIVLFGEWVHFIYDAGLYLVLFPLVIWLLLGQLKIMQTEREQARADSAMRTEFSQKLGEARTWDELMQRIVEYPHQVAPLANITLFVFNPNSMRMQPEAACTRDGQIVLKPEVSISPDSLPVGSLPQLLVQNGYTMPAAIGPGGSTRSGASATSSGANTTSSGANTTSSGISEANRKSEAAAPSLPQHRYDLSIIRNGQQIGVLKLEYPLGMALAPAETRALESVAPVMALALEGALLQNLAAEQAAASEVLRQKIAQNLHDTLAQNIGYLRLKLDQLTGINVIREISAVLQELERMRTIADEAYQQVRNTLDELNPIRGENLSSTLFKQAQSISQRARFQLRTSQMGTPHPLSNYIRQQILYIVREAFYNIEKHAIARQVYLQLIWLEAELIIKIADDGVGFDPLAAPIEGHYGLWIMQQRAQEIGGSLKISPASSGIIEDTAHGTQQEPTDSSMEKPGTEVTLWVPFAAAQEAACVS